MYDIVTVYPVLSLRKWAAILPQIEDYEPIYIVILLYKPTWKVYGFRL